MGHYRPVISNGLISFTISTTSPRGIARGRLFQRLSVRESYYREVKLKVFISVVLI